MRFETAETRHAQNREREAAEFHSSIRPNICGRNRLNNQDASDNVKNSSPGLQAVKRVINPPVPGPRVFIGIACRAPVIQYMHPDRPAGCRRRRAPLSRLCIRMCRSAYRGSLPPWKLVEDPSFPFNGPDRIVTPPRRDYRDV